jgi:hypothetical protein
MTLLPTELMSLLAIYWKDVFQGKLPLPSVGPKPSGYIDLAFDNQNNYSPCALSPECYQPDGFAVNAKCTCSCDGKTTALSDGNCQGFLGSLPNPPGPMPS